MTVETTGSLLAQGLQDGMTSAFLSGATAIYPTFTLVDGSPDGKLTAITGSDLAFDIAGGVIYIGDITNGAGGSAWENLVTD